MLPPRKKGKFYPLNQSPLYKITKCSNLSDLLCIKLNKLKELSRNIDSHYKVFSKPDNKGKIRTFEEPKSRLKKIHQRLLVLFRRIEPPPYLHSGIKGRSYITNAREHIGCSRLISLDISKFYPSTLGWHVYEFFFKIMHCNEDVAWILTSLCTCDDHVPTGSCISQFVAFYAHYNMFEEMYALSRSLGLTFTCYVDDITISGDKANRSTLYKIRGILNKRGLKSSLKKERFSDIGHPKAITGSIVRDDGLRLPNKKHRIIHEEIGQMLKMDDNDEKKLPLLERSLGRVIAGSQSDPALNRRVRALIQEKKRIINSAKCGRSE